MSEMDEIDRAHLASLLPDGAIPLGFITIAAWVDESGDMHWKNYNQMDMALSGCLGLLEMAKFDFITRTPGSSALLTPQDDDDVA